MLFFSGLFWFLLSSPLIAAEATGPSPTPAPPAYKTDTRELLELTVDRSIELALDNSLKVKKAKDTVLAAEANLKKVRSSFFPEVSANLLAGTYHDRGAVPGDTQIPIVARDRNNYQAELTASQSLFAGFRDSSASERSKAGALISEKQLEIVKYESIQEIIELYFGAQLALRNILAEKEVQALREQQAKEVRSRLVQGSATILDKLQIEYSLKSQGPHITALQAELDSRKIRLARLMNIALDQPFRLKSELPDSVLNAAAAGLPDFASALEFALRNNPTFAKYEAQLTELQYESGESMAKHLPSLDFVAKAGTNAYARYDIAAEDSLTYGAEIRIKIPIFSGLSSFAEREEWQAKLNSLKDERAWFREIFLEQLNDAYRKLELSSAKIEAEKVNAELAGLTIEKAQGFYGLGKANLSTVLDSYSQSLRAKQALAQSSYDRMLSIFRIKTLLGMGLGAFQKKG